MKVIISCKGRIDICSPLYILGLIPWLTSGWGRNKLSLCKTDHFMKRLVEEIPQIEFCTGNSMQWSRVYTPIFKNMKRLFLFLWECTSTVSHTQSSAFRMISELSIDEVANQFPIIKALVDQASARLIL